MAAERPKGIIKVLLYRPGLGFGYPGVCGTQISTILIKMYTFN